MYQADPVPPAERPSVFAAPGGQRHLPGWLAPARWKAIGRAPVKGVLLTALSVSLVLMVLGLGTSGAVLSADWSSRAWQPTPSPTRVPFLVTERVEAFYQGDASIGWDSRQQYERWWPSACSPAALTMVLRAWGTRVEIGSVLDRLIAHKAITPAQGLLRAEALAQVAQEYGYQAQTFWRWSVAQVAQVTAQGIPVLVDVVDAHRQTPYPALSVGHWLVVVGVSTTGQVAVRDSSAYRIRSLSPALFRTLFTGVSVVLWHGALALPA
jgi:hypothetical protein